MNNIFNTNTINHSHLAKNNTAAISNTFTENGGLINFNSFTESGDNPTTTTKATPNQNRPPHTNQKAKTQKVMRLSSLLTDYLDYIGNYSKSLFIQSNHRINISNN